MVARLTHQTLTFVPGTMCDRRVWQRVWEVLGDRFSCAYLPTETQLHRAGMIRLFEETAAKRHDLTPGSRLAIAEQIGHLVPLERSQWLAAQIVDFYQDRNGIFTTGPTAVEHR